MPTRGNTYIIPTPPTLSGSLANYQQDMQALQDHLTQMTTIVNQSLQSHQNRLNTIQQTGAVAPPTVTGLAVSGRQGLFSLTWNRIMNADGYVITQAKDSGMAQLIGRFNVSDGQQCSYQVPVGNVAVKNYFQVYAYQGSQYGSPSPAVSATTVAFTTPESAPVAPPIAPPQPLIVPVRSGPNL